MPEWLTRAHPRDSGPLLPRQIGALYRALRKAREDAKDDPEAGRQAEEVGDQAG
jgi:hypothetical protein